MQFDLSRSSVSNFEIFPYHDKFVCLIDVRAGTSVVCVRRNAYGEAH